MSGIPPRLTFVFAASTGEQTDIHEIGSLSAVRLTSPVPVLAITRSLAGAQPPSAGALASYRVDVGVAAADHVQQRSRRRAHEAQARRAVVATVPAPTAAQRDVAVYRAATTVLTGRRSSMTFTLPHPAGG